MEKEKISRILRKFSEILADLADVINIERETALQNKFGESKLEDCISGPVTTHEKSQLNIIMSSDFTPTIDVVPPVQSEQLLSPCVESSEIETACQFVPINETIVFDKSDEEALFSSILSDELLLQPIAETGDVLLTSDLKLYELQSPGVNFVMSKQHQSYLQDE